MSRLVHDYIGTEHLLIRIVREAEPCERNGEEPGVAAKILEDLEVDLRAQCDTVTNAIKNDSMRVEMISAKHNLQFYHTELML